MCSLSEMGMIGGGEGGTAPPRGGCCFDSLDLGGLQNIVYVVKGIHESTSGI